MGEGTLSQRWWDPNGPLVPLLSPGTEPRLDIANALLAMHRAGAAALKVAGDTPMLDDETVGDALTQAREAYAQPVLESIGKSLGDNTYAGLMVKDVADDAEGATIRLYRAAVSKGVPPPLAAERAALVYGVPAQMLGNYAKLALDPRAQPVALIDTADRALFTWAHQAADAELETIAKAESAEQRRDSQASEPRAHGRYASVADKKAVEISGMDADDWLAQQLAGSAMETTGPAEVATPTRERRKIRSRRVRRVVRQAPQQAARLAPKLAAKRKVQRTTRRQVEVNRIAAFDTERDQEKPRRTARVVRGLPGGLTDITGPVTAPAIGDDVAVALPYDEWLEFERAAPPGDEARTKIFTAGKLQQWAGTGAIHSSDSYDTLAAGVADKMRANPYYDDMPNDVVMAVDPEDVADLNRITDPQVLESHLNEMKIDYLTDVLDHGAARDINPRTELAHIVSLPNYHDPEQLLFVWHPPHELRPRDSRGGITVVDAVVDEGAAYGHVMDASRYGAGQVSLDPNVPLRVFSGPSENDASYDTNINATRIYKRIAHTDTDGFNGSVSKAESPEQRRAAQAREPRDHGHYTTAAERPAVDIGGQDANEWLAQQLAGQQPESVAERRELRTRRTRRQVRTPVTTRRAQVRTPVRRVERADLRSAARRAQRQMREARAAVPEHQHGLQLPEDEQYTLFNASEMQHVLGVGSEHAQQSHMLTNAQAARLYERSNYSGEDVPVEATGEIRLTSLSKPLRTSSYPQSEHGLQELQTRVVKIFHDHPGVESVIYSMTKRPDGTMHVIIEDATSDDPQGVHVLRWGDATPDNQHVITRTASPGRLLSPQEVAMTIGISWNRMLDRATGQGLNKTTEFIRNPYIQNWDINNAHPASYDRPKH